MRQKLLLSIAILLLAIAAASDALSQWVQTNGPFGGEVSCFASMGTNLFAGALDGGVFRSTDSGRNWKSASGNFSNITCLGSTGTNIIAAAEDGVFYSTDSGASWNVSANIPGGGGFGGVTGIVALGQKLFAATEAEDQWCSTYLSLDSGKTWADTGQPPGVIEALIVTGGRIFAGTDGGVFLSTDTGITWTAKLDSGLNNYVGGLALSTDAYGDTNLLALEGNNSWTSFQVYLSTNYGNTWTEDSNGLPSGYLHAIAARDSNIFVGGTTGVYRSTNNGASWTLSGLNNSEEMALYFFGSNLLAGTLDGLYLSTDNGKNWPLTGVPAAKVNCLASTDSILFVGTSAGNVFRSTNDGLNWQITSFDELNNNKDFVSALAASNACVIASAPAYRTLVSTDNGESWHSGAGGLSQTYVTSFAIDGSNIYAGTGYNNIFLSTDNGSDWLFVDNSFANNNDNAVVEAIAVSGANVFAATSESGIFLSTDNGATWDIPNNGFADTTILAIAVSGKDVFAASYPDGVHFSTNGGNNWKPANTGLENAYVYSFAVRGNNIFAGTDSGVYLSSSNGANWISVNTGLPSGVIRNLVIKDSNLFVGTSSSGVWRRPLSEMINTSAVKPTAPDVQPSISAYPNPCTSSTTITFSCAESGVGEVTIVNLLGAEVARLFSGELDAGEHSFEWEAHGAVSGVYECVVRVGGSVQRVPLAVLR
jgi:hypothetical protein